MQEESFRNVTWKIKKKRERIPEAAGALEKNSKSVHPSKNTKQNAEDIRTCLKVKS